MVVLHRRIDFVGLIWLFISFNRLTVQVETSFKLLTLYPTALLPLPYPTALGLIGPRKKDDI
jgi:hypothetical protein